MKSAIAFLCAALAPVLAWGYLVAPPMPLEQMVKEADLVLKVTAVSSQKVTDDSFRALNAYAVFATRMTVVCVIKGELVEKEIEFHHYDDDPTGQQFRMYSPQCYHFERGGNYVVFAKLTKTAGTLRPLWDAHRGREDQGAVRAADDKAVPAGTSVAEAIWDELTKLAASERPVDVQYAIRQLHLMSSPEGRYDGTADFPRDKVMAILAPLIEHNAAEVAMAAIDAIGSRSPYRGDGAEMGWMATVAKGPLLARGHAKYPVNWDNIDGREQLKRLVQVGQRGATPALRACAIRALGLCRDPALLESLRKWSADAAPEVRAAAAVLWSDFPGKEAAEQLARLSADPDASVRRSVAVAVGFQQATDLIPLLAVLLKDEDERVRSVAAMSAVSFDPRESATTLKAFLGEPDYRASFVDALALADPKTWLDDLAQIVAGNAVPKLQFVAQMPVYTSWQILKAEMDARTPQELAGGTLDKYLDALDQPPDIGSGPFQEMYQFYRDKGLTDRAARFRALAKKRVTGYDIDYYFKRVDGVGQT
jgi:hypothetical protein